MIKVSVIIPVYKVPLEYLRKCLDSLAAQTLHECEFIVISDGASEAELSVCKEYARADFRFKIFSKAHNGVSATRQFGLNEAKGQYVTFVDSDDWVELNYLDEIYKKAVENSLEILNWDYRIENIIPSNQVKPLLNHSISLLNEEERNLFLNNILINQNFGQSLSFCSTRLYKTSFLREKNITFNKELSIGEDKAFNYQAYASANRLGYINKTYYNYRMRDDSTIHKFISNSLPIYMRYINYIASICLTQNKKSLGKEFLNIFFHSLDYSYFPTNKDISIKSSISNLKKIIPSKEFQQGLSLLNDQKLSIRLHFYLFCLRKNILLPIYIKASRRLLKRNLLCFFKK
ncbi:MAG: glycosyltransferase family 2 protein [Fibrobacteraceae bacterium]|nr:glycosyltransferase family 2 protein [Fibrobacteraceae bacterium]